MTPSCDRPLAVFDLDGTLLRGDSLLPFLLYCGRRLGRWSALGLLPAELALYATGLSSDFKAKQALLKRFLRGCRRGEAEALAAEFAARWVERRGLGAGLERLHHHLGCGHRIILLSASPDVYVPAIAERLGITEVVCTRVGWDGDICRGEILGENCKGGAKVRMLLDHLGHGSAPVESYAYGDSKSDLPVLCWARQGHRLRRGKFHRVPGASEPCVT